MSLKILPSLSTMSSASISPLGIRDVSPSPVVFMLFDGDGFILQRQRVFTRIRSGAVRGGKQRRHAWIYGLRCGSSVHWRRTLGSICFEWLRMWGMKNPKGFDFYL
jgi:hypothetical protein